MDDDCFYCEEFIGDEAILTREGVVFCSFLCIQNEMDRRLGKFAKENNYLMEIIYNDG